MSDWQAVARQAAQKYGIDPNVFIRQINQESGGRDVTSPAGAQGPAQFIPGTARQYGLTSTTVHQLGPSLDAAARYMADNLKQYGSYARALSAYNSGDPDAYKNPRFAGGQTYDYVKTILGGHNPKVGPVSSSGSSGSTPSAGGVSSTAPSAPDLGGQGSDFTGLLAGLLSKPQPQVQTQALQAPAFAAHAVTPQAFHPLQPAVQSQAPAQDTLSSTLSLLQGLQGPGVTAGAPGTATGAQNASDGSQGIVAKVNHERATGLQVRISPHARPGDPVVASGQSVGGLHDTSGLAGFPAHDYFAPAGSHAVAPVSGTVVKLSGHDPAMGPTQGPHGPLGYSVYIKGDDGRTYFLTHLGSRTVRSGQPVQQGQIIGSVADYDKYGTPSHIHLGISG